MWFLAPSSIVFKGNHKANRSPFWGPIRTDPYQYEPIARKIWGPNAFSSVQYWAVMSIRGQARLHEQNCQVILRHIFPTPLCLCIPINLYAHPLTRSLLRNIQKGPRELARHGGSLQKGRTTIATRETGNHPTAGVLENATEPGRSQGKHFLYENSLPEG